MFFLAFHAVGSTGNTVLVQVGSAACRLAAAMPGKHGRDRRAVLHAVPGNHGRSGRAAAAVPLRLGMRWSSCRDDKLLLFCGQGEASKQDHREEKSECGQKGWKGSYQRAPAPSRMPIVLQLAGFIVGLRLLPNPTWQAFLAGIFLHSVTLEAFSALLRTELFLGTGLQAYVQSL